MANEKPINPFKLHIREEEEGIFDTAGWKKREKQFMKCEPVEGLALFCPKYYEVSGREKADLAYLLLLYNVNLLF